MERAAVAAEGMGTGVADVGGGFYTLDCRGCPRDLRFARSPTIRAAAEAAAGFLERRAAMEAQMDNLVGSGVVSLGVASQEDVERRPGPQSQQSDRGDFIDLGNRNYTITGEGQTCCVQLLIFR